MLVITRKLGEVVHIGDTITVKIVQLEDGSVRLGIDAPKEIRILRSELWDQIKNETVMAKEVKKESVMKTAALLRKNQTSTGSPGSTPQA